MPALGRALAICVAIIMGSPAVSAPRQPAIDALATEFLGESTPGLGILVTRMGRVEHLAGYGFADIANARAVTAQSIFDLASVSKQMTALAARMQMEAGIYSPQTPNTQILPQLATMEGAAKITVAHLIHHLSGLPDYLEWDDYSDAKSNQDVLNWLKNQDLQSDPGTEFDYSNTGYLVLGSVIAAADGKQDLAAVLQARIWGPMGMGDTALPRPADPPRRVTGYSGRDGDFSISSFPDIAQGDGNVHSTLQDLARYEAGFWDDSFLDDTSVLFETGHYSNGNRLFADGLGYGYGWAVSKDGDYADHTGGWAGTSTYYLRNLRTGVAIVLLANGEDADLVDLAILIESAME